MQSCEGQRTLFSFCYVMAELSQRLPPGLQCWASGPTVNWPRRHRPLFERKRDDAFAYENSSILPFTRKQLKYFKTTVDDCQAAASPRSTTRPITVLFCTKKKKYS